MANLGTVAPLLGLRRTGGYSGLYNSSGNECLEASDLRQVDLNEINSTQEPPPSIKAMSGESSCGNFAHLFASTTLCSAAIYSTPA